MIFNKSAAISSDRSAGDLSRGDLRVLLRKASSRNACAFTQATFCYFDFLSEYFYLIGYTDENERLSQIQSVLIDCWKYSPYIRRVSDLERFLGVLLEKRSLDCDVSFASPHDRLGELTHEQRFLLVARTFQNWSYRVLHLATRIKKYEIASSLAELKCILTGFNQRSLKTSQQILLFRVNDLLEGELKTRESRTIEKELIDQPIFRQFKADWLGYRCELAELEQQMGFEKPTIDAFKLRLADTLQNVPNHQPNFRDNLINQFSFTRLPSV